MHTAYDIIIVGGGMVGSMLACALAQQTSLSIAILEAHTPTQTWSATTYHHRVSAIALSSQRIFQHIHVWDAIKKTRVSPFNQIYVWETNKSEIQFDSREIAEPYLGYIIENNVIQEALYEKLKQYPQITHVAPVKLVDFANKETHVEMIADDGRVFSAKLAVGADGAQSWLRQQAGIELSKKDYGQHAIVATVQTTKPHQQTAQQLFLPTGPLAFLPLAETCTSSIVWSLPPEEAEKYMALDDDSFKLALAHAFEHKLGDVTTIDQRYVFPLRKQQAKNYVQAHLALIGDAAHTVHPLAGQGLNMGLLDAASLVDVIVAAVKKQRDFASLHHLRRYERWRKADNLSLLTGVDVIKHLFANEKSTVQSLRAFGLNMTNQMRWLKHIFTSHAVGDRAGLPSLAIKVN